MITRRNSQLFSQSTAPRSAPGRTRHSSRNYIGKDREIALVGIHGAEISCVGFDRQKHDLMFQNGRLGNGAFVHLGVSLGVFETKSDGQVFVRGRIGTNGKIETIDPVAAGNYNDDTGVSALRHDWQGYFDAHTGIRRLSLDNIGWDPGPLMLDRGRTLETDFGAPLPTGLKWNSLGNSRDLRDANDGTLMNLTMARRALLDMGVHPALNTLESIVDPEWTGMSVGAGVGSLDALEELMNKSHRVRRLVEFLDGAKALSSEQRAAATALLGNDQADPEQLKPLITGLLDSLDALVTRVKKKEDRVGTKELPNVLSNTPSAHVARDLGITGMLSTHVGACESSIGAIADMVNHLRRGRLQAGLAGGYESAMTPSAYYGFNGAQALNTNAEVILIVQQMLEEGALDREVYGPLLDQVIRRGGEHDLPLEFYRLASMPFARWRRGFVMGKGAGLVALMPLDEAIAKNRPIIATVAGVGDKFMDSIGSLRGEKAGLTSISDMGDGPRRAFEWAVREAKERYSDFDINAIGALVAHGTSTPTNGYRERRNFHEALTNLGRSAGNPLLFTGDKGLQGHRIGGNHIALAIMMLQSGLIPPVTNYFQPGHQSKGMAFGPKFLGDALDGLFPLTAIVGKAGVGGGKPVTLPGDYVYVNAAGFGHVNSGVLLRRWDPGSYVWHKGQKTAYEAEVAKLRRNIRQVRWAIDMGQRTYVD